MAETTIKASGFDGLRINHSRAWLSISPFFLADIAPKSVVNLLPGAIYAPSSEVSINGLPRRIFLW
jgi:hypothetical protein